MNSGNLVSRISIANRRMWIAIWIVGFISVVAIIGWSRSVNVIAERPVGVAWNDCMEYASKLMCNN